jgi:hypothetical protein
MWEFSNLQTADPIFFSALCGTDFFENFSMKSLNRGLSIDTTFKTPPFSLVNTFKQSWCSLAAAALEKPN